MNQLRHALDGVANRLNQAARDQAWSDRVSGAACDQADGDKVTLDRQDVLAAAELIHVLRRMVEGMPLMKAFGAPGDWGYNHPIGKALVAHLTGQAEEAR